MVVRCIEIKVMAGRNTPRVDTSSLKLQIERKIGHERSQKYINLLSRYFSCKMNKLEFNRQCITLIGRENLGLHNLLIRAFLNNTSVGKVPPPTENKKCGSLEVNVPNGCQRSNLQSLCGDTFPQTLRKGRFHTPRDRKFRDRLSPLGPNEKTRTVVCEETVPEVQKQQSAIEVLSEGSKPPQELNSVEDGEEVEQSPGVYSRSPVRAPLGISINVKEPQKVLIGSSESSCLKNGELPDTGSLRTLLEKKLEVEGLKISTDCATLLNSSLDVYLKRLIAPCVQLAGSRAGNKHSTEIHNQIKFGLNGLRPTSYVQKASGSVASLLDFRVAMELEPRRLGEDWPDQLEKVCLRVSDQEW